MEESNLQQVMSPTGSFAFNQRRKLQQNPLREDPDPMCQEPSKVMANLGEMPDGADSSQMQIIGQELVCADVAVDVQKGNASTTATPMDAAMTPRTSKDVGSVEKEGMGQFQSSSSQVAVWENGPQSMPVALRPPSPLFTPEQLSKAEEMQRKAPQIYGTPERQRRPDFLRLEEQRLAIERPLKVEAEKGEVKAPLHYHLPRQDEEAWKLKVEEEVRELSCLLRRSQEENLRLKRDLQSAMDAKSSSRFSTPQALLDDAAERRAAKAKEDAEKKVRREEKVRSEELPPGLLGGDHKEAAEKEEGSEVTSDSGPKTAEERTMHMVLKLMTGMQDLQRQILQSKGEDRGEEAEYVRYSQDLPRLPDWSSDTAPIDYNDWLVQITPLMSDLTASSEEWWSLTLDQARAWYYEAHMKLSPIQRLQHHPKPSEALTLKKWSRLERRASSMLLSALPEAQKEEVISSKSMTALGILAKSMLSYQPGGIGERGAILAALESPAEAASIASAVGGLRRWIRWRRRAVEIGASVPDATVLVRGLSKLMRRVLAQNPDLHFRLSLMRNELQIDTVPTPETVSHYSEHVLAELEQLGQHAKKKEVVEPVKLKKVEEVAEGRVKREEEKKEGKCRFYLTEGGCRRGRSCKWSHDQKDGEKRCFNCGSNKHFATSCPYKTSSSESPPKVPKAAKIEESEEFRGGKKEAEEAVKGSSEDDEEKEAGVMSELLEEANKMLKSLSKKSGTTSKLQSLQARLSDLKKEAVRLKTLRLTRISPTEEKSEVGLLDSGATHPLRALRLGDDPKQMEKVWVSLADGKKVPMLMTKTGIMVSTDVGIEPFLPLGWLLNEGGCSMRWSKGQMEIHHPQRGSLPVKVTSGCPQIEKKLALELIDEFDYVEARAARIAPTPEETSKEEAWLLELVEDHPVFSKLPKAIKDELVLKPGDWKDLPLNRHARRRLKDDFVCHLYAGPEGGFTLQKAMAELGCSQKLLEIDWLRDPSHDMLGKSMVYAALLRTALDGAMAALVGGPNCRSRSVLRHYYRPNGPRPLRGWSDGQKWGLHDLNEGERQKVFDDDVLLWRMLFLAEVAKLGRATHPSKGKFRFMLEQPAEPLHRPECVSFWLTSEWKALRDLNSWGEQAFCQGDFCQDEVPIKPTKLGGNLEIELPVYKNPHARARAGDEPLEESKTLARWLPNLMRAIAKACVEKALDDVPKLKALSWSQHVELGHVPMRRDCRVCQEASAKARPHRQVRHPLCATLALDTAGPYRIGQDVDQEARYMLVGTFTWLRPRGSKAFEEPEEPPEGEDAEEEDWQFEEERDLEQILQDMEEDARVAVDAATEAERTIADLEKALDETEESFRGAEELGRGEHQEGMEEREEPEIVVFRFAAPMSSKSASQVLEIVNSWFIQLRVMGYELRRIHTDRGGEFFGQGLIRWAAARGIEKTTTARDSKANGRVERAIQEMKSRMRRALLGAGMGPSYWPLACRYVHEHGRRRMSDKQDKALPPFGQRLLVRRRYWKTMEMEPTHEEVRYIAPVPEAHGHMVMRPDDSLVVVPYYIGKTSLPPEQDEAWIDLLNTAKEDEDPYEVRRRIRGKTAMKVMKKIEEEEEEERQLFQARLEKVIEEESFRLMEDDPEVGDFIYEELKKLKKAMPEEQEDVLRTKIISQKELIADHELWKDAIKKELDQLLKDREALRKVTKKEVEELQRRSGRGIDLVPSKLVVTLKPGPRRKVRLVACGNYIDKSPDESVYAAGADTVAVRYVLKRSAEEGWVAAVLDVHVAFLHAPLLQEESQKPVVLKPPQALVRLGYYDESDFFAVNKALYGLRQSPRCWGVHRDNRLLLMKKGDVHFAPSAAEPNLWQVKMGEKLKGFLLVYVDDMLACAAPDVLPTVLEMLREEWQTSEPEHLGEMPVKFLGMELRMKDGNFFAMQESYVEDKVLEEVGLRRIDVPCGKDCLMPPVEEGVTAEATQEAQKIIGELLWLSTRSRPDICFIVSRLSQSISSAPTWVVQKGKLVWRYVKGTAKEGLMFGKEKGEGWALEEKAGLVAYSDSSYAPHGAASQGAVFVFWNGALMTWRSSRQPFPTMSTAESELVEALEAVTLADAFEALVMEHEEDYTKTLLCDNMATVSLVGEGGAGWRTRHLRLRAQNLRWRVSTLEWRVKFCPGAIMIADAGTKPLPKQRLQELKEKMGMCIFPKKADEAEITEAGRLEVEGAEAETTKEEELEDWKKKVLSMFLLVASAQTLKGQSGNADELWLIVIIYTLLVVIATLWCAEWFTPRSRVRNEAAVHVRKEKPLEDGPMTAKELYEMASKVKQEAERNLGASSSSDRGGERDSKERKGYERKDPKRGEKSQAIERSQAAGPVALSHRSCGASDTVPPVPQEVVPDVQDLQDLHAEQLDGDVPGNQEHQGHENEPEVQPVRIFTTRFGEKYHTYACCPHLRNATRVMESAPCARCVGYTPQWRPNGIPLYNTGMGRPFHVQRQHPNFDGGEVRRLQPCAGCGTWSLRLDAAGRPLDDWEGFEL